jgi:CelD/BcsL family acetyltransferase involved in cellulose biosynthesis
MLTAAAPGVVTVPSPLAVEQLAEAEAFSELRQEWVELLEASESACIFLTWEWLHTWWKHLAGGRRLAILAVRRGSELIALAPFCLQPPSLSRARPFPVLEFLGSGFAGSDYLDVIVRKGSEAEARQALTSWLSARRLPLKLTNVKKGASASTGILAGLQEKGWSAAETRTNICPFIPLAGATWSSYLASLSAEHRYTFNRKWRCLERDYDVRFEQAHTPEQCREAIDLLIAQHNTRWRTRGGSDAFHTAELVAFHREWTQVALRRGWLRLYVLRLNEKPAACLYGLLYRGIFYFYQSSFDADYIRASAGLVAMGLAIRSAIGEGAVEYDLLHGGETYKSHWSRHSRDLARLEAFPPGGFGGLCRLSVELGRAARALARGMKSRGLAE